MDIQIKGTKYEPTKEIVAHAAGKIQPLARFLPRGEARAALELERAVGGKQKGDVWRAELTIDHEGAQYRAESTKAKLDHAITTVARDIADSLRRAKKKSAVGAKKGGSVIKNLLRFGKR